MKIGSKHFRRCLSIERILRILSPKNLILNPVFIYVDLGTTYVTILNFSLSVSLLFFGFYFLDFEILVIFQFFYFLFHYCYISHSIHYLFLYLIVYVLYLFVNKFIDIQLFIT